MPILEIVGLSSLDQEGTIQVELRFDSPKDDAEGRPSAPWPALDR